MGSCEKGVTRRELRSPDSRGYSKGNSVSLGSYLLFSPVVIVGSTEYQMSWTTAMSWTSRNPFRTPLSHPTQREHHQYGAHRQRFCQQISSYGQ